MTSKIQKGAGPRRRRSACTGKERGGMGWTKTHDEGVRKAKERGGEGLFFRKRGERRGRRARAYRSHLGFFFLICFFLFLFLFYSRGGWRRKRMQRAIFGKSEKKSPPPPFFFRTREGFPRFDLFWPLAPDLVPRVIAHTPTPAASIRSSSHRKKVCTKATTKPSPKRPRETFQQSHTRTRRKRKKKKGCDVKINPVDPFRARREEGGGRRRGRGGGWGVEESDCSGPTAQVGCSR
ncbi:hypothetical protein LX32DRAFT_177097 [Colletotrichum zoysiae]|uniref:Transmembrane protein n=1 Tax=Colletotrichum zoysiae TaxID=1216348 RepID=A0AAD9LYE2_9PEZI|nr:hypothetical protein LX32DRAFT_177097 [Colletotrichum zoysiae]